MVMQIPSNMILTRVRPSLYLPLWALVWSTVSACTSTVHTFGQLIAVRCLLGITEAPFFPGVFYLLSCWYTKRELGLRMAVLYSGLVIATAFSGLISAGVFADLDQIRGLAGWRVRRKDLKFSRSSRQKLTLSFYTVALHYCRIRQLPRCSLGPGPTARLPRIQYREPEVAAHRG